MFFDGLGCKKRWNSGALPRSETILMDTIWTLTELPSLETIKKKRSRILSQELDHCSPCTGIGGLRSVKL
jgi:hypothetical protein